MKKQIAQRLDRVKKLGLDPDLRAQVKKIPKIELHVHLGGSIRRSTIIDLADKNKVALPAPKKHFKQAPSPLEFFHGAELWELFHNTYRWYWSCVRSCDDLVRIAEEFLEDSYNQGVVHSEFTVSGSYLMKAFPFDEWTDAIEAGINNAERKFPIRAAAILDISRRSGSENATDNVKQVIDKRPKCICGIGMGGDEVKYPSRLFKGAFGLARENNLPATVHVAEFNPGETVIETINELAPNRLGHALNAAKSETAYNILKKSGLHVESCPLCNYVGEMGGIGDISEHPIKQFYKDNIPLSINTDDPQIFGFDLIDNYICLMKKAAFDFCDFKIINDRALESVFLN